MNLRSLNAALPLPILLVLIGILAALTHPLTQSPSATACFGPRSQANAQRGAEVWLRNRPTDSVWSSRVIHSARVQCLPLTNDERWAECHIGPVGPEGISFVVDCDTARYNNIGCVSGR